MNEQKQVHVWVSGIVQGVFFRAHTRQVAQSLHVSGWVRNLHDGRVEITAQGTQDALERFVEWCHHGPSMSRVDKIDVRWEDVTQTFDDFEIRY
ncbi:MAG: acylphosphatase [candidate division WOR-3 bacterium]|nr:MAG: acylphosphatase [candidate division WOR-3 bacterium]